jgi:hypothetical protein
MTEKAAKLAPRSLDHLVGMASSIVGTSTSNAFAGLGAQPSEICSAVERDQKFQLSELMRDRANEPVRCLRRQT